MIEGFSNYQMGSDSGNIYFSRQHNSLNDITTTAKLIKTDEKQVCQQKKSSQHSEA